MQRNPMQRVLNWSRPDLAFGGVWLLVLTVYIPFPTMITPPLEGSILAMVLINILTAPIIYLLIRWRVEKRWGGREAIKRPKLSLVDQQVLEGFVMVVCRFWFAFFIVNIIYSGGLPFIWYLTGDSREYADFGILSVSGFVDMFRCFSASLCIVLYLSSKRRYFALLWLFHLLPSVLAVSRGGLFIFLSQSIGTYLLVQKISLRQVAATTLGVVVAISMFVLLGSLRGIGMKATDYDGVSDFFGGMPVGVYWLWSYIATPLGNVTYAASLGLHPTYIPHYSLAYLLPSVVRATLFPDGVFTPLIVESLNATSIYSPLIMDFGIVGATVIVALLIAVASYVHVNALRGSLVYMMAYPALFAALVLSVFHIFAFTPGVLAVPFVCFLLWKYTQKAYRQLAAAT